jgi:hypothetical protein
MWTDEEESGVDRREDWRKELNIVMKAAVATSKSMKMKGCCLLTAYA